MKIDYPTASSISFLDRAPTWQALHAQLSLVAPHAATLRFDYTISPFKRAIIESGIMVIRREAVAAPVGLVSLQVWVSQGANNYLLGVIETLANTVDAQMTLMYPGGLYLLPGDRIRGQTYDLGVGGTNSYTLSFHMFTYDA